MLAFIILVRLFHAGMQYFNWVERRTIATYVAERRIAELRRWAKTQTNWSGPPTGADPNEPDFKVNVALTDLILASPSTESEKNFAQQRRLDNQSVKQAKVTVAWDRGQVDLYTILIDPFRGWRDANPIQLSGAIPSSLNGGGSFTVTATGYDSAGRPIRDLFFNWYAEPVFPNGARATINATRDGRSATFWNLAQYANGAMQSSNGNCRIAVRAVYRGQERWVRTGSIDLNP